MSKAANLRSEQPSQSPDSGAHSRPADHIAKLTDPPRLAALASSELMDAEPDAAFDRFTRLASRLLPAPVALVSLVDDHRQFFKSAVGLPEPWATARETPLTHSFCQYAVTTAQPLIVSDARLHPWLKDNLAITDLGVIAYAGVPLVTSEQEVLGVFCAIDGKVRDWTDDEIMLLKELAAMVATEIELRARMRAIKAAQQAQEEDRALLRSVLDCMEDSVVVVDTTGKVILSNQAAQRARPAAALESVAALAKAGTFLADGVTPMSPSESPSMRALHGETVRDFEIVTLQPGRPPAWRSLNSSAIHDASGTVRAAVSVGRDVTRAKTARDELARSEALFRTVVSNLPNGAVLLFDRELRYLMADGEQLLSSMGFTTLDLVGKTPFDVVPAERAEQVAARYRKTLAGIVQEFEVQRGEKHYACTVVPVHDEHGTVTAGMALVYDVTSHKQMQEQLRRQTLVFQSTLEHMREGVIMVDPKGELAVFNQAAKSFFGVSPQTQDVRALLRNVRFFQEDGVTPMKESEQPLARALRGEASFPTDVVVRRTNSAPPTHLHITVDPILDDQSTLLGSVAVLHNVSAQKAAEASAREEAAINVLLQGIAEAANNAQTVHDAFQVGLDRVCEFMAWPVGHVYLKQGELLKPTGWWHDADPNRFAEFRDVTSTLEFSPGVGMIGRVLASGHATWLVNLNDNESFMHSEQAAAAGLMSGFAFPVMIEDEVVAALEFYSERQEAADPHLLTLMANIGTQLGRVLERERARKAILEQAEQVRSLSIRDELTGLHNRRGFLELARHQLRLAERMRRSVLLFFFDLNGMKPINDQLGHDEGDRALRDMAGVLRASFRASDIIARLGGDEFVALLPDADPSQIDLFVGRIELETAQRNVEPGRKYELSTSIGATGFDPSNPEPIEELLVKADSLMYEAKRARKKSRDSSQPAEPTNAPAVA